MTKIVDLDTAIELFNAAMAEKGPDYVYIKPPRVGACAYFEENDLGVPDEWVPSCAVGHVVAPLGVSRDDLIFDDTGWDRDYNVGYGSDELLAFLGAHFDLQFNADAALFLSFLQSHQDARMPWERAKFKALFDMGCADRIPVEWIRKFEKNEE